MSAVPTISTMPCQVVLRCAEARGLEPAEICSAAKLDAGTLADSEARVPLPAYYELVEALASALDDPQLGLALPHHAGPEDYGLLGYLFANSASVGLAFARMMRFQNLVADSMMTMVSSEGRVTIDCVAWGPTRPAHAIVADAFAAETVIGFSMLCGAGSHARFGLELELARPHGDLAPYVTNLAIKPSFSAGHDRLSFDAAVFDLPVQGADPGLGAVLERQAEMMARLLPAPTGPGAPPVARPTTAQRVRELLVESLPEGVPELSRVAKRLGQSTRSLQRHLQAEDTTLKQIVEELRRSIGEEQLRRGAKVAEITLALGFSDVSAFHRAFKRWTGLSPGHWRAGNAL